MRLSREGGPLRLSREGWGPFAAQPRGGALAAPGVGFLAAPGVGKLTRPRSYKRRVPLRLNVVPTAVVFIDVALRGYWIFGSFSSNKNLLWERV